MQTANNLIFSSQNALNGAWRNINNWNNFSLHITGLEGNVWVEVSNDPNVLTNGTTINPPAAPVLSQYTPLIDTHLGGVAVNTTFYVKNTYVTPGGETTASVESSLLVLAGNLLAVAPPAPDTGGYAVGWNTYISTTSGAEVIQNLEDNATVLPLTLHSSFILKSLLTSGIVPSSTNTSGSPNSGVNITGNLAASSYSAGSLNQAQVVITGTQAMINPSGICWNFIRVCKDSTSTLIPTSGFLFGQLG